MKKLMTITATCFLLTQSLFASLPPLAQSVAELRKIFENPHLLSILPSSEPILKVERIKEGYLIITKHKKIIAEVVYGDPTRPGPDPFFIKFNEQK